MKKLAMAMVGLVVLGMTSVFALDGKKLDPKEVFKKEDVSYTYNFNNKYANDVSILMLKFSQDVIVEVTEYVIPAKSKESFTFEGVIGGVIQDSYRMGYINAEDDEIWWGGAEWWSEQKEIVIDKDGFITGKEDGTTRKYCKIKKYE